LSPPGIVVESSQLFACVQEVYIESWNPVATAPGSVFALPWKAIDSGDYFRDLLHDATRPSKSKPAH